MQWDLKKKTQSYSHATFAEKWHKIGAVSKLFSIVVI